MSKKIQLSIAEPCHENWDNMSPVDKGKFCGSCQKQVVDFSNMSDRQVAEFFKKPIQKGRSLCGRFMSDQLDRELEIPRKRIPWLKYFFQIAIPAFFFSIKVSAQTTKGKIKVATVASDTTRRPQEHRTMGKPFINDKVVIPVSKPIPVKGDIKISDDTAIKPITDTLYPRVTMGMIAMPYDLKKVDPIPIKGKIIDEKGEPLPFATIMIKGTKIAVASNANGEFSIKPATKKGEIVIVGTYVGCETTELVFDRHSYPGPLLLQLKRILPSFLMGELVACGVPPVKNEIKEVPLMSSFVNEINSASFKVFPNLVTSGSHITIEWKHTEEGYFTLQLLNQSGQPVQQHDIRIEREANHFKMDVPFVAAGSYFLVLTNKKTRKKFTEKIIIQ